MGIRKQAHLKYYRIQWALALNEWPQKCESLNKVIMAQTINYVIAKYHARKRMEILSCL